MHVKKKTIKIIQWLKVFKHSSTLLAISDNQQNVVIVKWAILNQSHLSEYLFQPHTRISLNRSFSTRTQSFAIKKATLCLCVCTFSNLVHVCLYVQQIRPYVISRAPTCVFNTFVRNLPNHQVNSQHCVDVIAQ